MICVMIVQHLSEGRIMEVRIEEGTIRIKVLGVD